MKKTPLLMTGVAMFVLFIQLPLSAQNRTIFERIRAHDYITNWQVYHENDQVRISLKYSDCSDPANGIYPEFLLFRVENMTNSEIHAYWQWSFAYDGKVMSSSETDEELVKITLQPRSSLEGSCANNMQSKLRLYVQDKFETGKSALTDFDIIDLNLFEL